MPFSLRRLHLHLLKDMMQTFILCSLSLLTLILIGRGLQLSTLFLGLDLSFLDVALLFAYMMPLFLLMVMPISCMLSIFLTFLRMSTDRELIALKAGGISIYQMARAPFFFSLLCMGVSLLIAIHSISWGMSSFRTTILQIASSRAKVVVQPGVFNKDIFSGITLFARKVDPVTGKLQQVLFEDKNLSPNNRITVLAPEGALTTDEEKGELVFTLDNGHIYRMEGEQLSVLGFAHYAIRLDLNKAFAGIDLGPVKPKEMTWKALARMDKEKNAPSLRFQYKVGAEKHKRLALPAACLVLGMFAIPLACAFEGVRRQIGVVLSLCMFLLYYSLFSLGLNASEAGQVPPAFGLWGANVFFGIAAGLGLYLVGKERNIQQMIRSFFLPIPKKGKGTT